jgi:hypothetical protein
VMIHLNQRGFGTDEILDALERVCRHRRNAYDEDPDPAEDPLDEGTPASSKSRLAVFMSIVSTSGSRPPEPSCSEEGVDERTICRIC